MASVCSVRKSMGGFLWLLIATLAPAQQPDAAAVIRDLDTANQSRFDNVLGFTDVEHYKVFRGEDQTHPAAEMTVRTTYTKGIGKSYIIVSQSGSGLIQKLGLQPILDSEKAINDPARVAQSWFTSANYEMHLQTQTQQVIDGHTCVALSVTPRHKAPNMIEGTIWVDAGDHTLVKVEGTSSKSASVFAGTTKMMRRYVKMQGYAMATQARAESTSKIFGPTVIVIDYSDYHFQLR
ncbi:hypothetical protein P8935_11905 [Telmatobacter sp. DSM 110680]|uniref:Outer membrane lipoprotein-sorting protein n=1 Tax=Telmatobacter sp. DSM 110680 TaxID=3036704 RepID=A0AAU7DRZ2_9BACT